MTINMLYLRASNCTSSGNYASTYTDCNRVGGTSGSATGTWYFKWALPECSSKVDSTRTRLYMLPNSACNSLSAAVAIGTPLNYSISITSGIQDASGNWVQSNSYTIPSSSTNTSWTIAIGNTSSDTNLDSTIQYYAVVQITRPRNTSGYYFVMECYGSSENPSLGCTEASSVPTGTLSTNVINSTSSLRTLTANITSTGCPKTVSTQINTSKYDGTLVQSIEGTSASVNLPEMNRFPYPYTAYASFTNTNGTSYSNTVLLRYGAKPAVNTISVSGGTLAGANTIQLSYGIPCYITVTWNTYGEAFNPNAGYNGSQSSLTANNSSVNLATGAVTTVYSVTPTATGTYTLTLSLNDTTYGQTVLTYTTPVNNLPSVSLTQSSAIASIDDQITYTADAHAPTGAVTTSWNVTIGTEVFPLSSSTPDNEYFSAIFDNYLQYKLTYKKAGSYEVRITGTSTTGESATALVTTTVEKIPITVEASVTPRVGSANDTIFTLSYTSNATRTKTTLWTVKKADLTDASVTIVSGSITSETLTLTVDEEGVFSVGLQIGGDYYDYDEVVTSITTKLIPTDDSPLINKFKIFLYDGSVCQLLLRTNLENNAQFQKLSLVEELNKIGVVSFEVYHSERWSTATQDLLTTGKYVVVFYELYPIFHGEITSVSRVNTDTYNTPNYQQVYQIKCESCEKILDTLLMDQEGILAGSISDIAKTIIPTERQGVISSNGVQMALPISKVSRLITLNNLSDYTGWRYRGHPKVVSSYDEGVYTQNTITNTHGAVGDQVLCQVHNSDSTYGYTVGYIESNTNGTISITNAISFNVQSGRPCKTTIVSDYAIDFMTTYYLEEPALSYRVNQFAQKVNNSSNINDKFSKVSVYATDPNRVRIAKDVVCNKSISLTRVIHNATYITDTKDTTIMNIELVEQVVSAVSGEMNRKYNIYLNGWNFDSTIRYVIPGYDSAGSRTYVTVGPASLSPHVVYSSSTQIINSAGEKQTIIVVTLNGDDNNTLAQPMLKVGASFIAGIYTLLDGSVIQSGSNIRVGSIEISSYTLSGNTLTLTALTSQSNLTQCSHLVGCLVYDTGTDTDSPYTMYHPTTLTVQGPDGYTESELELLACRYYQFGSTYTDRGTLSVPLTKYTYVDMNDAINTFARPGSHIRLSAFSGSNLVDEDYEILKYEMSADTFSVKVSYGMSEITIMDRIYTLIRNNKMVF